MFLIPLKTNWGLLEFFVLHFIFDYPFDGLGINHRTPYEINYVINSELFLMLQK